MNEYTDEDLRVDGLRMVLKVFFFYSVVHNSIMSSKQLKTKFDCR